MRLSKEPPYASLRRFESGDTKLCSRYPWAPWISTTSKLAARECSAALRKSSTARRMSSRLIALGGGYWPNATLLGPSVCQAPSLGASGLPPAHGLLHEALRPACAIWIAGTAPCLRMKSATGFHAFACASDQIPASHGVMRPSGLTALASTLTNAAPPTARLPRCTKCHSLGMPSSLEYWHIGETKMRFLKATERSSSGEKRRDMG